VTPRPVLFVTGHAPADRVEPFRLLHESQNVHFALWGGRLRHGGAEPDELPFPHEQVSQRQVHGLAASGRFRAVVCGTAGRVALPAAFRGARRREVPFVLWASLWAQPRSAAGLAGYPALRGVYRAADAVATYGPHVTAYVRARGARNVFEAPQAVDNEFWSAEANPARRAPFQILFSGRLHREKGLRALSRAWRKTGLRAPDAALVLVGRGPERARAVAAGATHATGQLAPTELRNFYGGSDVLVLPSIPTRTFREPWGLVVNEAMNQGLPVIASDAVGAVAGGLVRDERNGLVVPAGDPQALAAAIVRLREDPQLRARLGAAGLQDVRAYTPRAWADGVSRALGAAGAGSRGETD
jgi:glycosyltransferase involved in cell wall biosynthesis